MDTTKINPPEEPVLKQKTINYLNTAARESEQLFAQAVEYRAKYNAAKTSVAREMYSKKLKKIVSKLDRHMALFSALEQIKAAQETPPQDESVTENP